MQTDIYPLGDSALTIDFGQTISPRLNNLARGLQSFVNRNPFPGLIETVPAYSSVTIFYDVGQVRRAYPDFQTAFAAVQDLIRQAILRFEVLATATAPPQPIIKIPVCYDSQVGLDLEFVAAAKNLSPSEIIQIHLNCIYRVFMLGFLPGFPYLGETNDKIRIARKAEPRLRVPRGSVGIAGGQTGIYPFDSPGGWQIIGRTPLAMFDPTSRTPTLLQAGDAVQFYRIEQAEFDRLVN